MQLMIRTRATARGRMLPQSQAAEDSGPTTFTAGSTTPIRCRFLPPCSATAASFEALRQSRWLRTADGFAVCAVATRTHHESP